MANMQDYLNQVKIFNEVTPEEADHILTEKAGHIVYIGRETCPYCRRFVDKLSDVAETENLKVNYLNSQNPNHKEAIQHFRSKYYIPTVPGFLYSNQDGLKVKCDSSMSKEEIISFVNG